jgi:predicted GIY-YIG superfamily endonuclease
MGTSPITLYVLRSLEQQRRYVGITNHLARRLHEHEQKLSKGSQLLARFEVVLLEEYPSHIEARAREKFLKSGQGRRWLDENLPQRRH